MESMKRAQAYMASQAIDGWLLYDFRGSNPVFQRVVGREAATTRRNLLWMPREGAPVLLAHGLDKQLFEGVPFERVVYTSWPELRQWVQETLGGQGRVAMEYSPGGAIPMHSWVDGGTIEMVRGLGAEVVSSADLFQAAIAAWSPEAVRLHREACAIVAQVKDDAFAFIGERLAAEQSVTEYDVQQFIREAFTRHGLETDHGPIVGVNAHSGDPHYEPSATQHASIRRGDWILIDLWAKHPGPEGVYCDITWTGYAGAEVPARHREVFETVLRARDAVVERLHQAWQAQEGLQGWQLDQVARDVIAEAGYGDYFTHRTGHSMGPSPTPHALGANLDNLETHDTRSIMPGTGFSVEPGIYLPEFGVRSEIDVYVDPEAGPQVTTEVQREVICLG